MHNSILEVTVPIRTEYVNLVLILEFILSNDNLKSKSCQPFEFLKIDLVYFFGSRPQDNNILHIEP